MGGHGGDVLWLGVGVMAYTRPLSGGVPSGIPPSNHLLMIANLLADRSRVTGIYIGAVKGKFMTLCILFLLATTDWKSFSGMNPITG